MNNIELTIPRQLVEPYNEEKVKQFHQQRAKLIHELVDTLDLNVKDWGGTDDPNHHEVVTVIIALASAGVFTAMIDAFKIWLEDSSGKIDVTMKGPNGSELQIHNASGKKVKEITETLGLEL